MEDIKGKKLVTIKILINQEKDEFGTDIFYQGFGKEASILDQLALLGALETVKKQILFDLEDSEVKEKQKDVKN